MAEYIEKSVSLLSIEHEDPALKYAIERVPAADVVEVIRCKDCAHYGGITFGNICRRWSGLNVKNCTKPDDFCSYGIKKDW